MFHRRQPAQAGMTLLETMIVLAIVGLMMVVGYMGVRHIRQSDLREDATKIAATLRAARTMAVQSGLPHRVILDMEKQTYGIEVCERGARIAAPSEDDDDDDPADYAGMSAAEIMAAKKKDVLSELGDQVAKDRAEAFADALARQGSACQPVALAGDDEATGKVRKDRGIEIKEVWAQHFDEPKKDGQVTLSFFPLGYTEKAVVVVATDDASYSLVVHGMTGRIEIQSGELDDPEDVMTHNVLGDKEPER